MPADSDRKEIVSVPVVESKGPTVCEHCGHPASARVSCTNPGGHRYQLISLESDIHDEAVLRGLRRMAAPFARRYG